MSHKLSFLWVAQPWTLQYLNQLTYLSIGPLIKVTKWITLSLHITNDTNWPTQCDTHNVTHTTWPKQCDPHNMNYTMWPTQCDPHNMTHTVWPTHGEGDLAMNDTFENKIADIFHRHSMKAHSGNHILSHHSTKSIPRAYVGKPTCFARKTPN